MASSITLSLCLFISLWLRVQGGCDKDSILNSADVSVLWDIYQSTNIPDLGPFQGGKRWEFDSGGTPLSNPCCNDDEKGWKGLACACEEVGQETLCRVVEFVYKDPRNNKELTGTLPDSMGSMSMLSQLNLRKNHLGGTIPDSIGSLTALTVLDLSENEFSGIFALCDIVERAENGSATDDIEVDIQGQDSGGSEMCYLQCWADAENGNVQDLTFETDSDQCDDPTSAPTVQPTKTPTTSRPTGRPSAVPSSSPSTPTLTPTSRPTSVPTVSPTSPPTTVPTSWPTMHLVEPLVEETVLNRVSADYVYNASAAQDMGNGEAGGVQQRHLQQRVGDMFYHSELITNLGMEPLYLSAEIYSVRLSENFAFTFLVNGVPSGATCKMVNCYPAFVECFVNAEVTGHVSEEHGGSALIEVRSNVIPPLEDTLCGITSNSEVLAFAKYSVAHIPMPTIAPSFAPTGGTDLISSVADLDISLETSVSVVLGAGAFFGMIGLVVLMNVRAKSKRVFVFGKLVTLFTWGIAGANIVSEFAAIRVMYKYREWVWTATLMLISRLGNIIPGAFILFYIYGPAESRSRYDFLRLMDEKHWMSNDKVYFYVALLATFVSITFIIYLPWINTPFVSGSNGYPRVLVFKIVQSYNMLHSGLKIISQGSFVSGQGKKIREDIFSYMNLGFSCVVLGVGMMEYFVKFGTLVRLKGRVKKGKKYNLEQEEEELRASVASGVVKLHTNAETGEVDLVRVDVRRQSAIQEGSEDGEDDGGGGGEGGSAYREVKIDELSPAQIRALLLTIQRERSLLTKEKLSLEGKVRRFEHITGGAFDELDMDDEYISDSPHNSPDKQDTRGSVGFSLALFSGGRMDGKSKGDKDGKKKSFLSSFYYTHDEETGPVEFTPNPMVSQVSPPVLDNDGESTKDTIHQAPATLRPVSERVVKSKDNGDRGSSSSSSKSKREKKKRNTEEKRDKVVSLHDTL